MQQLRASISPQFQQDYNTSQPISHVYTYHTSPECPVQLTIHHKGGRSSNVSPIEIISRASSNIDRSDCNSQTLNFTSAEHGNSSCSDQTAQIIPIEVNQLGESSQRMIVDGDALTLVILDCSPQPNQIDLRGQIGGERSADSASSMRSSYTDCYGHTDLILRHQHGNKQLDQQGQYLSIEQSTSAYQPQTDHQQHQQQQIVYHPPGNRYQDTTSSSLYQTSQNHRIQQFDSNSRLIQDRSFDPQDSVQSRQNQYQEVTRVRRSVNNASQPYQTHSNNQANQGTHTRDVETNQNQSHLVAEMDQQVPPSNLSPRPGYRLVKRWDWKSSRFIWTEVPDRIAQQQMQLKPQETESPSNDSSNARHNPQNYQDPMEPKPSSSRDTRAVGQEQQESEPSWLSYRVPDTESVQTDPLYRDLMLELQKLEEGVNTKPPEVTYVGPETTERPVFSQAVVPNTIEVDECENVEFICHLTPTSDPTMQVVWYLNGQPLRESSRITSENDFGIVRLKIGRCEAEDSGVYQCKAKNALGEAITTATLRVKAKDSVQYESLNPSGLDKIRELENPRPTEFVEEPKSAQPPKFITHLKDYVEKDEGESLHLECCLSPVDDPDLKIEWLLNGRPLVTGSRFHTIDDFGFIVMDIDWLFPRDTGEYICRATNKHGSDVTRTVLRVKPDKNIVLDSQLDNPDLADKLRQLEFPDVVQEQPVYEPEKPAHFVQQLNSLNNKRQFNEGENVHFEARVAPASDGNLTVEWYHNDKPLMSGHRFKPSFDFGHIMLDILYVYPEDSGVYKCVTRNLIGTDVSQFEIHVTGKPSLDYHTQLPDDMVGGVQKLTDMEAMWNRPPDPEEEEAPMARAPPQFVLKPIPYNAFEGSCARFCCRITGHPRPRLTWTLNGQVVVSGSRYKLTYDGMYHLTIPKCQLSDAGKVEVYAKNPLGDCIAATQLKVRPKVDDYRSVLKRSPNPWYDEQVLQAYRRQRLAQDTNDDEDSQALSTPLILNDEKRLTIQPSIMSYMEPGTPEVNLLTSQASNLSPLLEPGDLHPSVIDQQAVKAPAPSTIKRAMNTKDSINSGESSFKLDESNLKPRWQQQNRLLGSRTPSPGDDQIVGDRIDAEDKQKLASERLVQQSESDKSKTQQQEALEARYRQIQQQNQKQLQQQQQQQQTQQQEIQILRQQQQYQQAQEKTRLQQLRKQQEHNLSELRAASSQQHEQQAFDPRLPPPSPENKVHGKEIHSHYQTQTQLERRANKEIKREIIEREIFEQEHRGMTRENVVRASSVERGSSQSRDITPDQQQSLNRQQRQVHFSNEPIYIEDNMIPPEFIQKIQPCQAIDGDEACFECSFIGDPTPTISWYRESKMIKPSNLYNIITDLNENKSTLLIRRVSMNANAVFTVKAENAAGSAKSSANLVVEPHPLPESSRGGRARQIDAEHYSFNEIESSEHPTHADSSVGLANRKVAGRSTSTVSHGMALASERIAADQQERLTREPTPESQKVVRSVRTRVLSPDDLAALIRASPEGLIAPTFLHTIHDVVIKPGELCRLDARLLGSQPMDVRWIKDGKRVRADKLHKLLLEGDLYTLLILESSASDAGLYECLASNIVGESQCQARLIVSEARGSTPSLNQADLQLSSSSQTKIIASQDRSSSSVEQKRNEILKLIKRLENQQVKEGKSVTLRCQICSFPMPQIQWFKHGNQPIKPSKYFRIFKDNDETYCLRIMETFHEDQGEYKCVATAPNGRGQIETTAMVTVIPNSPK